MFVSFSFNFLDVSCIVFKLCWRYGFYGYILWFYKQIWLVTFWYIHRD